MTFRAAANQSGKSSLTWLIPVAALLVPGFLFYNWWSSLNAQSRKELEKKVRSNPGVAVFLKTDSKLTNPLTGGAPAAVAPSTATAAAPAVAPSSAAVAGAAISSAAAQTPVLASAAVPVSVPAAVPASTDTAPGAAAPSSSPAASAQAAKVPGVAITRDPTLSPYDVVRLAQLEQEKANRGKEITDAIRPRKPKKPAEPPIEDSIDLQGIVEIGSGNKAIINGDMIGVGELVLAKAKIVQITADSVVFEYKRRRFTKSISK